jgi:hypothetical protein
LLVIGFVVLMAGLIALLFAYDGYWSPAVKRDRERLDSLLATGGINVVEIHSFSGSNVLTGLDASNYVALLKKTNPCWQH